MSDFERIYQTDPSTECDSAREMHPSIELSDDALLERMGASRTIPDNLMHPESVDFRSFGLDGPSKGKKDAKDKSKVVKSKARKDATKPNKAAVARVQTKL